MVTLTTRRTMGERALRVITGGRRGGAASLVSSPRSLVGWRSPRSLVGWKSRHRWLTLQDWMLVGWLGVAVVAAFAAVAAARGRRRPGGRRVGNVMVNDVLTLPVSATLLDAAQKMREGNVGMLPIVDADGKVAGIVTDRDLVVRAMARAADPTMMRALECASRTLATIHPDASVDEAMEIMRECRIGRLPVVDDGQRLVGVVTLSSLALRSPDADEALDTAQEVSRRSARSA